MNGLQTFSYVAIAVIFLSGWIPLVLGIIHYVRELRHTAREERDEARKRSTQAV